MVPLKIMLLSHSKIQLLLNYSGSGAADKASCMAVEMNAPFLFDACLQATFGNHWQLSSGLVCLAGSGRLHPPC